MFKTYVFRTASTARLVSIASLLTLSGCLATGDPLGINALNTMTAEMLGSYQAPTLAAYPTPSGCQDSDSRCRTLDQLEAHLYQEARSGRITWTQLVDSFYTERARAYPNTNDNYGARELFNFQRMLAEQMDLRKITESQWVYYHDQRRAQANTQATQDAANSAIINQQRQANQPQVQKPTNCWTTRSGNNLYTTCN